MVALFPLLAYSLVALQAFVAGSPVPDVDLPPYFRRNPVTRRALCIGTLHRELGPLLSNGTLIFGPESSAWDGATHRWNMYTRPDVRAVVKPIVESDVARIVTYCYENGIEFLAVSHGHGLSTSLRNFSGLQIYMDALSAITIQEHGETAILQGGVYAEQVINTLHEHGYITPTGSTSCVGVIGAGLGGGHGRHEGQYGLVSDSMVHFNIVLANGTEVGANATSHEDLFWAMQGAGHNFGIVTSIEKRIYPDIPTWHTHRYIWSQEQLETVFETLNEFHRSDNGTTPVLMGAAYGWFIMNYTISETEPVLSYVFDYAGPAEEAEALLEPFNAIESLWEDINDVTYIEISRIAEPSCISQQYVVSSAMTLVYNVTAERILYDHFNETATLYPELARTAIVLHEGYSIAGVQAVDFDSTAYAHRGENHIMLFDVAVPEGTDLHEPATTWAREAQQILNDGQPDRLPAVYINYASGNDWESLESIYGHEEWRLEKLRDVKARYDPTNRFRYYVPIEG